MAIDVPGLSVRWRAQGVPKPIPPVGPRPEACAQAQCAYCGRFGVLGQCQGCGAANQPNMQKLPARQPNRILLSGTRSMGAR